MTKVFSIILGVPLMEVSPDELAKEAEFAIGVKPTRASWGKTEDANTRTAFISFPHPIKTAFKLFKNLALSRSLYKRTNI